MLVKRDWFQILTNIGVILGLTLLAYELEQTRLISQAGFIDASYQISLGNLSALLGENPADAIAKSVVNHDSLTAAEREVVRAHHISTVIELEHAVTMASFGNYGDGWDRYIPEYVVSALGYPYGREFWNSHRENVTPQLRDIIDAALLADPNGKLKRYRQYGYVPDIEKQK
jgi:hypothetical protein